MKVKVESEKVGLKLNIQKTKIMASGPITSWEIDGETMETVSDFIFLGSKITADGDCSHEIKRCLLLGDAGEEAETPILWPRDANWLIWKDPDAGKDWRWEKGMTEDEMVGWHHWHDGLEFE